MRTARNILRWSNFIAAALIAFALYDGTYRRRDDSFFIALSACILLSTNGVYLLSGYSIAETNPVRFLFRPFRLISLWFRAKEAELQRRIDPN